MSSRRTIMRSIIAAIIALFGFLGIDSTAAAAPLSPTIGAVPSVVHPDNTWSNYYYNYFTNKATCTARGNAITDPNNSQYIPGALAYYCYLRNGAFKWSMDIYWD